LSQAEGDLSDPAKRDELDAVMLEARAQTLKANSLPVGTSNTDPRVLALVPSFKEQIRAHAKEILIEEEGMCVCVWVFKNVLRMWLCLRSSKKKVSSNMLCTFRRCSLTLHCRAIKMNLANEGLEARRKEEEAAAKKRKAEEDARWEGAHLTTSQVSIFQIHRRIGRYSGAAG
jgi:DnaJ family protein C protein 8